MLSIVKEFLKETGLESTGLLILILVLLFFGMKGWSLFIFGAFVGKNWEVIKTLYKTKVKAKLKEAVK